MLLLSNICGNAIQNGIDIAANNIPSAIDTIIKSINQAIKLSIHSASGFFIPDGRLFGR